MPADRRGWDSLSDLVLRAMPATGRLPGSASLREAAGQLATVTVYGVPGARKPGGVVDRRKRRG